MDKPYIVGLTGGIASGKTTASDHLSALGANIVDSDEISRALTGDGGEAIPEIRALFGDGVMKGQSLDRRALAYLIFGDAANRRALEGILHPMIQKRIVREMEEAAARGDSVMFLVAPLLFETGMDALCDEVWLMALTAEDQITRAMERDGSTREEVEARIKSQMSLEEKMERTNVAIRTNRPIEQTLKEIESLYRDLERRVEKGQ